MSAFKVCAAVVGLAAFPIALSLVARGLWERSASPGAVAEQARARQAAWAEQSGRPVELTNSIGMAFRLIPPGEFVMGASPAERRWAKARVDAEQRRYAWQIYNIIDSAAPQHRVRITQPFYLAAHEVTVGAFKLFIEDTAYKTDAERDPELRRTSVDAQAATADRGPKRIWRNPTFPQVDDHPVVYVSWNDAMAFCNWLSGREGREYRLPTEAEWEYACRAGAGTMYHHGNTPHNLVLVANVADQTYREAFPGRTHAIAAWDGFVYTAPVGCFVPNGFGLYDMHGNVAEWCMDWYDDQYYANSPIDDPPGPRTGSRRVAREGSWTAGDWASTSASRSDFEPDRRNGALGFRIVLVPAKR